MPGLDLNLDLPTLADTFADIVSKLVVAIDAIETDLAARVTAGELDITTALSMGGAPLINVGGVRLNGGVSTTVGTIYMDGADLHVVTALGDVQLTAGGAIDVAALGTIGGDYGGVNPAAVIYDDTSGEYRFTQETSVWANLVADDLVLHGTAGSVRLGVADALTGAKTVLFKALPASGVSGVVYNVATTGIEDAAVTRETNTHLFTGIDAHAIAGTTITASTDLYHPNRATLHTFDRAQDTTVYPGSLTRGIDSYSPYWVASAGFQFIVPLEGLESGDRLKSVLIGFTHAHDAGGSSPTLQIVKLGFGEEDIIPTTPSTATNAIIQTVDSPAPAGEGYRYAAILYCASAVTYYVVLNTYDRQP